MAKSWAVLAAALFVGCLNVAPSRAQSVFLQRLQNDRLGAIRDGTYQAGDDISFSLNREGPYYLLRFAGQREVFVLHSKNASLGGRVLKYDTGRTVLQITGWGAMTLYTDAKPSGLPVTRTGDSTPPTMPLVSLDDVKVAASAEAQRLAATRELFLTFHASWQGLADDAESRAACLDALENAAKGIARFATNPAGQRALAAEVQSVRVIQAAAPSLYRSGHDLIVTYAASKGFSGRASSRAITRVLHQIFHIPAAQ
ncbi:MAG: DUF4908 domain-containing protein [Rhizomicrobium sp.]